MEHKAREYAREKHAGQLRDDGKEYFSSHIKVVAELMKLVTDDEEVIAAAYLHDTVEDCGVTYDDLVSEFNTRVADLVMEVTHEGSKQRLGYYFPRLHSREAIMIKFADRLSNIASMEVWDEKRKAHYLKRSKFWKLSEDESITNAQ